MNKETHLEPLDFRGLFKTGTENKAPEAPKKPTEPLFTKERYKNPIERQKPIKEPTEGLESQEIIKLQAEILQGVKEGENMYSLLLKACKVISLVTSNDMDFYNQVKADTQQRLQRYEEAIGQVVENTDKERIQRAVTAYKNKIAELEADTSNAN